MKILALLKWGQLDIGINEKEKFVGIFLRSLVMTKEGKLESHSFQCQLTPEQTIYLSQELSNAAGDL